VNNIIEITTIGFDNLDDFEINIYPNPTNGQLNIDLGESVDYLFVANMGGQVLDVRKDLNSGVQILDISHLPDGVYLIQIVKNKQVINRRIVKQ
jgi:hypothetical protein